jgi:hypothetical protein
MEFAAVLAIMMKVIPKTHTAKNLGRFIIWVSYSYVSYWDRGKE